MIELKSPQEIEKMRIPNQIVASVLARLRDKIVPGITTESIDKKVEAWIREEGGEPAFLGYRGFPASICASVNDEVVHGIPDSRKLVSGDIISVDVGVLKCGFYGDAACTYPVGKISRKARNLIELGERALLEGLSQVRIGSKIGDVASAIQRMVNREGCSVVRQWVGHGIGRNLHEDPAVPNFGKKNTGVVLEEGMCLAIEPMVIAHKNYDTRVLENQWTVVTETGALAVHVEHTIAITKNGIQLLTAGANSVSVKSFELAC